MTTAVIECGTELHRAIDDVINNPAHQPTTERLHAIERDRANGVGVNILDPLARLMDLNARHRDERTEEFIVSPIEHSRGSRATIATEMESSWRNGRWAAERSPGANYLAAQNARNQEEFQIYYDGVALSVAEMYETYRRYLSVNLRGWDFDSAPSPAPRAKVDAPSRDTLVRTRVAVVLPNSEQRTALALEAEDLLGYTPLRDAIKASGALRRALAALELDVLDEQSVDKYKAQMVQHYATHNKMASPTWRLTALAEYALPIPEYVLRKAVAIKKALPEAQFYIDHLAVDPFLLVSMEKVSDPVFNQKRTLDPETQAYVEVWLEPKFEEGL